MYKIGDKIKIVDVRKITMFPDNIQIKSEYEVLDVGINAIGDSFITIDIESCSDYPINDFEFGGIELVGEA